MGGKSLMINKIFLVCLFLSPLSADLSIDQMQMMVKKIKAKRIGSMESNASKVVSPFIVIRKDENKTEVIAKEPKSELVQFALGAIVNDKAFVNNKWLSVGDMIDGYELSEIEGNGITMTQDSRTIKVFLKKSKQIIKLNEG